MTPASKGPGHLPDLSALSALAPQLAQTFVSMASDIALVIDASGVIRNVAMGAHPIADDAGQWVGRRWSETVSGDTRLKVEQLLSEAHAGQVTRRREVNHTGDAGEAVPVAYAAVRLGRDGPVLAVGRDLRAVSAIQQRFLDAQQALERDYWRQRQNESSHRMLMQVATDGVLVVDATSLHVVEANRAALQLFQRTVDTLVGQPLQAGIAPIAQAAVEELLAAARTTGRPGEIRALVCAAGDPPEQALPVDLSATPFRAGDTVLLLVRVRAADRLGRLHVSAERLADFVERTPDAVVITDALGRVLTANPAFGVLCRDAGASGLAEPPLGLRLDEALGDPDQRLVGLLAEARRMGIAEQRVVCVGHRLGEHLDIELSAALLAEGDQECLGLILRRLGKRHAGLPPQVGELALAIDRLATQVGAASLPELLQQTADLAERHLIESALDRVHGDRQQAARLLGISAADLWARMAHLGLDTGLAGRGPSRLN